MVPQNQKKVIDEILHKTPYKVSFVDERVVVPVRGGESSVLACEDFDLDFPMWQAAVRRSLLCKNVILL